MAELVTRNDLSTAMTGVGQEFRSVGQEFRSVRQEIASLREQLEIQTLRLTVRLGVMLAAGLSILAALQRLH